MMPATSLPFRFMPNGYFPGAQSAESMHMFDPKMILQLAQTILGMSTIFYTQLDKDKLLVQGVYQQPGTVQGCPITAGSETLLEDSYCQFAYRSGRPLVVEDAQAMQPFDMLAFTHALSIGSYAGVPLVAHNGTIIGSLCGIDQEKHHPSPEQMALLQMLGHALMVGLERGVYLDQMEQQCTEALLALRDPLTDLPNRRAFDHMLESSLARAAQDTTPLALIFIDIDHFKQVNDTYGHCAGDSVLRLVAARLTNALRMRDSLFRIGGEELVAIVPNELISSALAIAERMRTALHNPLAPGEHGLEAVPTDLPPDLCITASFGVAIYPLNAASANELLKCADAAMYAAKENGRDRVCGVADVASTSQVSSLCVREISQNPVVEALVSALSARDGSTGEHGERLVVMAEKLALQMNRSQDEARMAGIAARLHDIGKLGIPDAILHKPGPLNEDEWQVMRQHPAMGQSIVQESGGALTLLAKVIGAHHERWDGTGYPQGRKGAAIPLAARIIAVIDAFDAMTSDRPYHKAISAEDAITELTRFSGTQFDPHVVEAFLCLFGLPMHAADKAA